MLELQPLLSAASRVPQIPAALDSMAAIEKKRIIVRVAR